LWGHPEDRGRPPYASIFATEEFMNMESRTGARRACLHQCCFGAPAPRGTCISSTFVGIEELNEVRCPGASNGHQHGGRSSGLNAEGHFNTRRLQTYPPAFARAKAYYAFLTLRLMLARGSGPTGFLRHDEKVKRVSFAGARHLGSMKPSVSLLNEDAAAGGQIILDQAQSAVYLHVDDGMLLSTSHPGGVHADKLLHHVADGLEVAGFDVSDRQLDSELTKIIGYTASRDPARFQLPGIKLALLRQALLEQVGCHYVDVEVIRSLVGSLFFAALLRRDVLSIPCSLDQFMDAFEGQRTAW
jgi:hypothetical protein